MNGSRSAHVGLLSAFVIAYLGVVAVFHEMFQDYARQEAEQKALDVLLVHRAVHAYVTRIQRPEVYRLQDDGLLSRDYFSPKLMSFTYVGRNVQGLLNEERRKLGLPEVYFKLATDHPRNPINQADALESDLLRRMNEGRIDEFRQVIELEDRRFLYLAVPIARSNAGCMRCHGDPASAPADLIRLYGDQAGFRESPDSIRALISIRVPFESFQAAAQRSFLLAAGTTLAIMAAVYALIVFFLRRLDAQRRQIMDSNVRLEYLSITDALTGIHNRRGFARRMEEEIKRADRFGHPLSLVIFDLDRFKDINDRHGHPAGDEVLKQLVRKVTENIRGSDIFGRWGGEEFLVLLPQQSSDMAAALAEKLRRCIEEEPLAPGIEVTISLGVARYRPGERADDLIARVDQALYAAKTGGRNRVSVLN